MGPPIGVIILDKSRDHAMVTAMKPEQTDISPDERGLFAAMAGTITEAKNLGEALDRIFQGLAAMVPCERLDAGLLEEDGHRLVIQTVKASYEPVLVTDGYTVDIPGSFYERCIESGRPFISNPAEHRREFETLELSQLLADEGINSHIVVPVAPNGTVLGTLSCGARRGGAFTGHHGVLLAEAARLLQYQIEKAVQADRIEKNYRAYMEMLSFVAHELKSPISSIMTMVQTLGEGYYGKMDERQRDILDRILKKAEYLNAVSSQYLNLSRFEGTMMEPNPRLVDFIDDVLEPIIDILLPQIEERKVRLERDYGSTVFPVRCDPDLLKIVVMNLVGNGIKYGNRGGALRISLVKEFKKFSLAVWNEGPGFSEQEKHLLFKKFSRLKAAELIERKGSGIGLYVSWKIVQLHCGRLTADSERGSWARFTMEMPQYMDLCIVE